MSDDPSVRFDEQEENANNLLLEFMRIVQDEWGLNANGGELAHAIHTLQLFVIKRMLQRLNAVDFSDWYDQ